MKIDVKDLQKKTARFRVGSSSLGANGSIRGYFSIYATDRADSYGDVCKYGCFAETIKERERIGKPFPLCYNHDLNQIIGAVTFIEERKQGAYFEAMFFDTPEAQHIRELIKSGVVYQLSFAYSILDSGRVQLTDGTSARELRKLNLHEISVVPVPAEPRSVITDVKSDASDQERKKKRLLDYINKM